MTNWTDLFDRAETLEAQRRDSSEDEREPQSDGGGEMVDDD